MSPAKDTQLSMPIRTVDEQLGHRLRLRRTLLNLTQEHVARECGISYQQVHKYETGQSKLNAARLVQFGKILNVPVGWFFDGLDKLDDAGAVSRSDAQLERTTIRLVGIAQQIQSKQKLRQLIDFAKILVEEDQCKS